MNHIEREVFVYRTDSEVAFVNLIEGEGAFVYHIDSKVAFV